MISRPRPSAFTCRCSAHRRPRSLPPCVVRPRAGIRADTLGPVLSKAVAALDSNLPTYFPGTPAQFHNDILSGNRVIATLFTIFGLVAFILSGVGLYGVMSFSVNQRTQEFGIRMALGADAVRILRMVMSQGAWQLAIGLRARRRRRRAPYRRGRARGAQEHSLQGQSARPDDLLCGRRIAHARRRLVLFSARASRHPRRSDGRAALRMKIRILPIALLV